jgi:hypothetical protein
LVRGGSLLLLDLGLAPLGVRRLCQKWPARRRPGVPGPGLSVAGPNPGAVERLRPLDEASRDAIAAALGADEHW